MTLALYPVAGDSARVRVWAGMTGQRRRPRVQWTMGPAEGSAVSREPTVVRPFAPVRGETPPTSGTELTWSGLFEFELDEAYRGSLEERPSWRITARCGRHHDSLTTRVVPHSLKPNETLRVLLVSCYCRDEDENGAVGRTAQFVARAFRPDLSLLMGDQVYLDLPTMTNFPKGGPKLLDALEANYTKNWLPDSEVPFSFADVLRIAPWVALPDDHEYWNNAPHFSAPVENSYSKAGRGVWQEFGHQLFRAFQGTTAEDLLLHRVLDLEPLSIFAANGRSFRSDEPANRPDGPPLFKGTFHSHTVDAIEGWANSFRAEGARSRSNPLFVTGQSMFDKPASRLSGALADYTLPNYADYAPVMRRLDRLAREDADVLCLTGDVHWGRVAEFAPSALERARLFEVITSPSALVTTPVVDPFLRARGWLKDERWPRHAEPLKVDSHLRIEGLSWTTRVLHRQKGDQVCVLELRLVGDSVQVTPNYIEVGSMRVVPAPSFRLRRRNS